MTLPDIPAALDLVIGLLDDVGIPATVDPARVDAPGVWLKLIGIEFTLGDGYVRAEAHCVVPANDLSAALPDLDDLASEVIEVLGRPDDDIRVQATALPSGGASLPTLVLPYRIA